MSRFVIGRFAQEQNDRYGEPFYCDYCGEVHVPTPANRYPLEGCPAPDDSEED